MTDPLGQKNAEFGSAICESGRFLIAGVTNENRTYLFDLPTGSVLRTFAPPYSQINDGFGATVSVAGNIRAIGVPDAGSGRVDLFGS